MEHNWFGSRKEKKGRLRRVKPAEGNDCFSNVIVVEWDVNRDRPFRTMRRYLRSWKKLFQFEDKEKKS